MLRLDAAFSGLFAQPPSSFCELFHTRALSRACRRRATPASWAAWETEQGIVTLDGVCGLGLGQLPFQPTDVVRDPQVIASGLGGGKNHRLEAMAYVLRRSPGPKLRRCSSAVFRIVGELGCPPAVRRASVTRLVVSVLSWLSKSGQEPSGRCLSLRKRVARLIRSSCGEGCGQSNRN